MEYTTMMGRNEGLLRVLYTGAGIALGLGIGYITWHQDFSVNKGIISYKGEYSRPIVVENEKIKVGDIVQRVNDLLDEPPARIKASIEYNLEHER